MIVAGETLTCGHAGCGIVFEVPARWVEERRADHKTWYCPNGHARHFPSESTEEKLRRERDRLAQQIAQRDDEIRRQREMREATERQLSATRGVVTRIKNRVGNGVCPCCNRSFKDLARHMNHKHPTYSKEQMEAAE